MATILVVDDRAENREFLVTLLGYRNYRVLEARDGNQALELARGERPDLVITDILMPAMDGYELVRRLRGESALASTQVIFYTAHFHRSEAEKLAHALSVAHILTKPSEPEVVLKVVADALGAGALPPQGTQKLAGFTDEHVRVMTDKLSATVDALSMANDRLHALIDVNLELASQREPQALLDSVCRHARNLVAARSAMIAVTRTDNGETVTLSATAGISDLRRDQLGTPDFSHGLTGRAYHERASGRVSRVDDPPATFGLPKMYPPFRNLLVAPVSSAFQDIRVDCGQPQDRGRRVQRRARAPDRDARGGGRPHLRECEPLQPAPCADRASSGADGRACRGGREGPASQSRVCAPERRQHAHRARSQPRGAVRRGVPHRGRARQLRRRVDRLAGRRPRRTQFRSRGRERMPANISLRAASRTCVTARVS